MTGVLTQRVECEAFYHYHVVRLGDAGLDPTEVPRQALAEARGAGQGLVAAWSGGAVLLTGAHTGHMTVVLEAWHATPPALPPDWDEVVSTTYVSLTGAVTVLHVWDSRRPGPAQEAEARDILRLPSGPGQYTMRVHARGRVAAQSIHGSADHIEARLIQFWPSEQVVPGAPI